MENGIKQSSKYIIYDIKPLELQQGTNNKLHPITWGGKATRLKYKEAHEHEKVSNM